MVMELSCALPLVPSSAGEARRFLRQALLRWDQANAADVVTLLGSELVTNAVLHGHGRIDLGVRLDAGTLRVEVGDASPLPPVRRDYGDEALTGRGLELVEVLASSWGVSPRDHGKVVWFQVPAGGPVGPPAGDPATALAITPSGAGPDGAPDWGLAVAEPAEGDDEPVAVRLAGLPVRLFSATREHTAALLREFSLIAWQSPDTPAAEAAVSAELDAWLGAHTPAGEAELGRALARGDGTADVVVPAGRDAAAVCTALLTVLDRADERAREGELLSPPALPEVVACRRWYLGEVIAQLAGGSPTPWTSAADDPAGRTVLDQIEHGRILDELGDAIVVAEDDNRVVYVNPAAVRLLDWPRHELEGQRLTAIIPPRLREAHVAGYTRYLLTRQPRLLGRPVRVPACRRDGAEVEVELRISAFPVDDGRQVFVASLRDLADRVQLERQVSVTRSLRATSEVASLLGLTGEVATLEEAAPAVLEVIGSHLGWEVGALWTVAEDRRTLQCLSSWQADGEDVGGFVADTRARRFPPGVGLPGRVWSSGKPAWISDVVGAANLPRAALAGEHGLRSAFAFPILCAGTVVGAVEFFSKEILDPDPDLLGVVATIGGQLGLFAERIRAEQELRRQRSALEASHRGATTLARTLQASLLPPTPPTIPGLEVAAVYRPAAEQAVVGGDFYDLFSVHDEAWDVVIGDVCGKGAAAAARTALARYTVRAAAMHRDRPSAVLADLNDALQRRLDETAGGSLQADLTSCTAVYVRVRRHARWADLELCCAGHPQPLLLAADGSWRFVGRYGTLLGPFPDPELHDQRVRLSPGDMLVLFTDGLTDARWATGFLGDRRVAAVAAGARDRSAAGVVRALEVAVTEMDSGALRDDLAILALGVSDERPPAP
jgi:PAS domain S-box-containing protein